MPPEGKSDAVRVCYVYLQEHWIVLQVLAYSKSDKLNLSKGDHLYDEFALNIDRCSHS